MRGCAAAAAWALVAALASQAQESSPWLDPDAPLPIAIQVELADVEQLEKDRKQVALSNEFGTRVQRYLERAGELVEAEDAKGAQELLERLQRSRLNRLETAYVHRMLGFVAYGDERPDDAIQSFERALGQEAMRLPEERSLRYSIAQIHMSKGEWEPAIRWFKAWLHVTPDPAPAGYYLQAITYHQLKQIDAALAHVQHAIEVAPRPEESWLRLLAALHAEREDFRSAAPVLEELILRYPSKPYWVQYALIQTALESYELSLAVQQLAHRQGYLVSDLELTRLARAYLYHNIPYPAAELLEREFEAGRVEENPENFQLLANSWIAAREYQRALPPLQRAAEISEDGALYVRLAQVHMERDEWGEAVQFLERAIGQGGLEENPGSAEILLGIARYNDGNPTGARAAFQRARRHEAARPEADRWLEHIARELGETS